jgi:hypothetical protein
MRYGPLFATSAVMKLNCSIVILTALVGVLFAMPATAQQRPTPQAEGGAAATGPSRQVSTVRSDGALYSGVRQRSRRERPRTSDITTTRRLLSPSGQWRVTTEPVDGGNQVAPTDGRGSERATPVAVDVIVPLLPRGRRRGN